ncbi:MAG: M17 family peptidase N-terminal domain-containing protein [Acidimicrobiales bacterium]
MHITMVADHPLEIICDRLVVLTTESRGEAAIPATLSRFIGARVRPFLKKDGFTGAPGDLVISDTLGLLPAETVALVGVGIAEEASDGVVSDAMSRAVSGSAASVIGIDFGEVGSTHLAAAVEGAVLGLHRFALAEARARRGAPTLDIEIRVSAAETGTDWEKEAERGRILAESVCWARDLVDLPSHYATPERLADEARHLAAETSVSVEVLDIEVLEKLGFGGVLGVGGGGEFPPRVVVLRYEPTGAKPLGLVGKGITFDAGGYHLKSLDEMRLMKSDMSGAAAVMGALRSVALCGARQDVVAVLPFAENLLGRNAYRPSDVVVHYGGKTSEVIDPDNEGRMILADALGYISEFNPTAVIDIATLTDAGGLGPDLWAVLASDRSLAAELLAAGHQVGEPGWELPLWHPYRERLRSNVADIANADRRTDNAVLAALFLADFVGDVPWAHIDLGHAAFRGSGVDHHASGVGVRTLARFLADRAAKAILASN